MARTLKEIADFTPEVAAAQLRHARVHRVPMAVAAPVPGTERRRLPQRTTVPGLWLAGDWTRTGLPCSMESATRAGLLAAEGVLADRGTAARLALPVPETAGLIGLLRRRRPGRD
ncbi:MAG: FAD-dependent oxidoreductase [Burkholderiales bacterium]|nr:FAD-dependent oxidoreductase [Burkholderiales bacterium]